MKYSHKKIITTHAKQKINGCYSARYVLYGITDIGNLEPLTWNQYRKLNVEDTTSEKVYIDFVRILMNQIKNFGEKVTANAELKKMYLWNFKIEHLIIKYYLRIPKTGLKIS